MRKILSKIPFNYKTVTVTQSRIDKGLLAIPVSLVDYFPKHKTKIYVASVITNDTQQKSFTPYTSSSRECRIGGMKGFYEKFQIKDGDEIVIQILDENKYRILPEKQFERLVEKVEDELDNSKTESEASVTLNKISRIAASDFRETVLSEYYRLSTKAIEKRGYGNIRPVRVKESTPAPIRKLLTELYHGKCQMSGFGFLMKNGNPYFEIHHIKPNIGCHFKNLLVVSPNVHTQFTYATVEEFFDKEGWLRRVRFNGEQFRVQHVIDQVPGKFMKEVHFEL